MSDEEYETTMYQPEEPQWRFSWWDVAGIGIATTGGIFHIVGNGLTVLAQQCQAMANHTRACFDAEAEAEAERIARAEMAETYENLVGMDTYWLENEEEGKS